MDPEPGDAIWNRIAPGRRADAPALPLGLIALVTAGLGLMMQYVDRPLAHCFALHAGPLFQVASFLTRFGNALWWLLPSLALFLVARFIWRSPAWAARALFVFTSVAVCGILVDLIKLLAGRARPELWFSQGIYGFSYPHLQALYQSFPSGHAACASSAGVALSLLFPRHRPLWVAVALVLGLTRVIVTAHYLSDVVAASLLAALIVLELRRVFARHGLVLGGASSPGAVQLHSPFAARLAGSRHARPPRWPAAASAQSGTDLRSAGAL
ncbi:MAG TPA: phosphatase PAP2 family protein [Steroidobacteraceae bacterium]|nr:phosphatase PAP2 family protein [Steroidobacteraceae bacterium]